MSSYDEHLISMAGGDGDALDAIQRRADKATAGPWHVDDFGDVVRAGLPDADIDTAGVTQDSEFIAHARTDVPDLLALVREQAAKLEAVRALVKPTTRSGRITMILPDQITAILEATK